MQLIEYIQSYVHINPETRAQLQAVIVTGNYPKNHVLHHEGAVCRKLFFIQKGIARIFYYKDGKDITFSFAPDGTFTTLVDSFFEQKPSRYSIELLEPAIVSFIQYNDLMELFKQSHQIERFGRIITTEFLKSFSDRLTSIQFQTAAERYHALQLRHGNILPRIALGHIASYLGITQETLSRLRAKG